MYKTITIDRKNLTLLGVQFPDLKTLESTANAIGTNMFEGFEPTKELIQLYVDWKKGILPETDFLVKLHAIYERYMQGTINSDVQMLTELIFERINKSRDKGET